MKKLINWFKNEESGQGMVEYGLIIALIAAVIIAAFVFLGPKIETLFKDLDFTVESPPADPAG